MALRRAVFLLGTGALLAVCLALTTMSPTAQAVPSQVSPTPLQVATPGTPLPTVTLGPGAPCGLKTDAERQAWVDHLRAARPAFASQPHLYDRGFIQGAPPYSAFPQSYTLPQAVREVDTIAVLRVVAEELDASWTAYRVQVFVPSQGNTTTTDYFGVHGRSRLAVAQVLKGDATGLEAVLTMPFFIAANSQCEPIVALGGLAPRDEPPVFRDERVVVFLWKCSRAGGCPHLDYRDVKAGDKVPILTYGMVEVDPQGVVRGLHPEDVGPAKTEQQFVDAIRAILAQPATREERVFDTIRAALVQRPTEGELMATIRTLLRSDVTAEQVDAAVKAALGPGYNLVQAEQQALDIIRALLPPATLGSGLPVAGTGGMPGRHQSRLGEQLIAVVVALGFVGAALVVASHRRQ